MSETLSPSEFQSLFSGLNLTGKRAPACSQAAASTTDLTSQFTLPLSLVPAELAQLQTWLASFVQGWQQDWSDGFRTQFSVGESSITLTRLREFVSRQRGCRTFEVRGTQPDSVFWIALDDQLVADHLSFLLGAQPEGRSVTIHNWGPVEIQLTGRLIHTICSTLLPSGHAFESKTVELSAEWISRAPLFLLTELIQVELQLMCGQSVGSLRLGIPRRVAQTWLASGNSTGTGDCSVRTTSGENIADEKSIKLRATLGPIQITTAELQQLEIGDVILLGGGTDPRCDVRLNDEQQFTGTMGSHQGLKAIQLAKDRSRCV